MRHSILSIVALIAVAQYGCQMRSKISPSQPSMVSRYYTVQLVRDSFKGASFVATVNNSLIFSPDASTVTMTAGDLLNQSFKETTEDWQIEKGNVLRVKFKNHPEFVFQVDKSLAFLSGNKNQYRLTFEKSQFNGRVFRRSRNEFVQFSKDGQTVTVSGGDAIKQTFYASTQNWSITGPVLSIDLPVPSDVGTLEFVMIIGGRIMYLNDQIYIAENEPY
jgi:hypothetical protein